MVSPGTPALRTFLDELLAEQQHLDTPVARFSSLPARGARSALEPIYRDLIPLSAPSAGEQYAFEVSLDSCTGCKACVSACHSLNGLDDEETWRDVGLVIGSSGGAAIQQTITTACHHCADPGCLNGCPVLAYEKDPATGIVRHLDDQCIGCQYCVLKCPYDVPKYSKRLGIVRKCDMCHSRLAVGEAPACVQACPTHAIRIVTVPIRSPGTRVHDSSAFLSVAPDTGYTQPTTRYLSQRVLPTNLSAADLGTLHPQPAHWPLILLLTFMPMAVGCFALAPFAPEISSSLSPRLQTNPLSAIGWLAGSAGLAASAFHLGKPWRAWRIFLGWRKSWLSREALVLGPWLASASAALFLPILLPATALIGAVGLSCSVMVYVDTRRELWRFSQTAPRFFGTATILGMAAFLVFAPGSLPVSSGLATALLLKLAVESDVFRPRDQRTHDARTEQMLRGPYRRIQQFRLAAGLAGGVLLPLLGSLRPSHFAAVWAFAFCLGGELTERYLFFRTVDTPKMPGLPAGVPPLNGGAPGPFARNGRIG